MRLRRYNESVRRRLRESEDDNCYYVLYTFEASYPDFVPKRIGLVFRCEPSGRITGFMDGLFDDKQPIDFDSRAALEDLMHLKRKLGATNDSHLMYVLRDSKLYNNELEYITTADSIEELRRYIRKYKCLGKI